MSPQDALGYILLLKSSCETPKEIFSLEVERLYREPATECVLEGRRFKLNSRVCFLGV